MKIVGLIFLILGLVAAGKVLTGKPPRQTGNAAYDKGGRMGRVAAPVVLIGLGLGLLLRRGNGSARSTSSRPLSAGAVPPRAMALPIVTTVPVKIYCGCGQHYSFDIEPVAGRMPAPVACPVCGADGTDAANAGIAQTLSSRLQSMPAPQAAAPRQSKVRWVILISVGVIVMLFVALIVSSLVRSALRRSRLMQQSSPQNTWTQPGGARRGAPTPGVTPPRGAGNPAAPSRPGSKNEAAPVPPNVTAVEVFWGSSWWKATILRRDGERAFIHYEGWGSNYDEWVTPDRMRPR